MTTRRRMALTAEQRFWAKVDKSSECWEWTAFKNAKGYGTIYVDGKDRLCHRFSYELANGPIPNGLHIDHRCHNRACVRPDHLRLATAKQNKENLSVVTASSGVRGVTWHKLAKKWDAKAQHHGKTHRAGLFATIEEAEAAVIALRNELFTHNDADRMAS